MSHDLALRRLTHLAQDLADITEFDMPESFTTTTWTGLTKNTNSGTRREILLDLSRQIDALVKGKIDQITLVLA